MVDAVTTTPSNINALQRSPQPATANLRSNQNIAQTLINQAQNGSASRGLKSVSSKPAGFATDLPPGSLVDILV